MVKMLRRKGRTGRIVLCVCAAALLLLLTTAVFYVETYYLPGSEAMDALSVAEQTDDYYVFSPAGVPKAGLIFYPGGKVDERAYAPLMKELSSRGVLCFLMKMPFRLAVLKNDAAKVVPRANYPDVEAWVLAGHSLGGAMASVYAAGHADAFDGLVLMAAYSPKDLSGSGLKVLSLYGSEDGVLNREKYEANLVLLPPGTTENVISGGCHAFFGDYGHQKGDGTPLISAEKQWIISADEIVSWLDTIR